MKTIKLIMLTIASCIIMQASAQQPVELRINHMLGDSPFELRTSSYNDFDQLFQATRLEYYISGISIMHDGGKKLDLPNVYILVDASKKEEFSLGNLDVTNVESINFCVGVDQTQNHADPSKWPRSHALSHKSPSMHWGWEPGYRFAVFEGVTNASLTQKFTIHALGNKNYFKINIPTRTKSENNKLSINLNADYIKALSQRNLYKGLFIHGEDEDAAEMLRNFQTKVFTSTSGEGNTLAIEDKFIENSLKVFPNPSSKTVNIQLTNAPLSTTQISIFSIQGKLIHKAVGVSQFQLNKGVYYALVENEGIKLTRKILIN